jgi:hypothetical protein
MFRRPIAHGGHAPQAITGSTATRSPIRDAAIPAPTASTLPTNSWPMTAG